MIRIKIAMKKIVARIVVESLKNGMCKINTVVIKAEIKLKEIRKIPVRVLFLSFLYWHFGLSDMVILPPQGQKNHDSLSENY